MYEIPLVMGLFILPFVIAEKGRSYWSVFGMGFCFGMAVMRFLCAC